MTQAGPVLGSGTAALTEPLAVPLAALLVAPLAVPLARLLVAVAAMTAVSRRGEKVWPTAAERAATARSMTLASRHSRSLGSSPCQRRRSGGGAWGSGLLVSTATTSVSVQIRSHASWSPPVEQLSAAELEETAGADLAALPAAGWRPAAR